MLEKADEWYEDCKEKAYCVIIRYKLSYQIYTEMSYSVMQSFDI